MALAYRLPTTVCPEVLTMTPKCSRHRVPMNEVCQGCYRCPVNGCDQSYDAPAETPRLACVPPAQPLPADNALVERAFGYMAGHTVDAGRWRMHVEQLAERQEMRLYGPIPQVPQSNARDDQSCMNGPAAPGGGSKSSGRKRKKSQGGKTFVNGEWWNEGGTNKSK